MSETKVDYGRCKEWVRVDGRWGGQACGRTATGEDGLCGPHRAGVKRKEANRLRWDAESRERRERYSREARQAAFVKQWRKEHAIDTWGAPWLCPLCNKAVQDFFALTPCDAQIEIHQESHGAGWLDYQALASADPQPAPTTGGE